MGVDVLGPPSTAVESMLDWIKSKHGVVSVSLTSCKAQTPAFSRPVHKAQRNQNLRYTQRGAKPHPSS